MGCGDPEPSTGACGHARVRWLGAGPGPPRRGAHPRGDRRRTRIPPPPADRAVATEDVASVNRVIFMCGPSGAGKSTYAKRLESAGMVRLSFDVEMWRHGISTVPLPPDVRSQIETDLRAQLVGLVEAGVDVVLDFSFWSRRMRDDYRELLRPTGVVPETIYLATDRETILSRMRARRGSHCDDFVVAEDLVAQ